MDRDRELQSRLARALVCLCALILLPLVALAEPPYGGPQRGPGGGLGRDPLRVLEANADELGLDEETRTTIRARIDASQEETKRLEAAVRELYHTLQETLDQDAPDRDAVMAVVDSLGRTEIELRRHRIDTLLEVRALLTPEQRARARELGMRQPPRGGRGRMRQSCHDDAQKLCADAPRGRARFDCLREHEAELSPACREALQAGRGRQGRGGGSRGGGPAGQDARAGTGGTGGQQTEP
jgi:Spy/CpxP family protein refolding chaperone